MPEQEKKKKSNGQKLSIETAIRIIWNIIRIALYLSIVVYT